MQVYGNLYFVELKRRSRRIMRVRLYTSSAGSPVKRFISAVLIGSLLMVATGCGNVFIRGAIKTGSSTTGSVSFVQLGNVLNGTGGTVQVTFVTFLQNGFSSTIGFC